MQRIYFLPVRSIANSWYVHRKQYAEHITILLRIWQELLFKKHLVETEDPFSINPEKVPTDFQLEVIKLQASSFYKTKQRRKQPARLLQKYEQEEIFNLWCKCSPFLEVPTFVKTFCHEHKQEQSTFFFDWRTIRKYFESLQNTLVVEKDATFLIKINGVSNFARNI